MSPVDADVGNRQRDMNRHTGAHNVEDCRQNAKYSYGHDNIGGKASDSFESRKTIYPPNPGGYK